MAQRNFLLKNTGEEINNDVVLPGAAYLLQDYKYLFTIKPQSKYWRFGIRLSRTPNIKFFHPVTRINTIEFDQNFIDIHISVGDKLEGTRWYNKRKAELVCYNLKNVDHVLLTAPYDVMEILTFGLSYELTTQQLNLTLGNVKTNFVRAITINPEFKYFKVCAWSDNTAFELECELNIESLQIDSPAIKNTHDLKVGNIVFRRGDMFDDGMAGITDLFLLPASTTGTATYNILNRASELGIPYPTKNKPGTVAIFRVTDKIEDIYAGYGYSVDDNVSSIELIKSLINSLVSELKKEPYAQISKVNLPLFGSGAGDLDSIGIASSYDTELNENDNNATFYTSILSSRDFEKIAEFFTGRSTRIRNDKNNLKTSKIIQLERVLNIELDFSSFNTNKANHVTRLNLKGVNIKDSKILQSISTLKQLSLYNCTSPDFSFLGNLKDLEALYLNNLEIQDYSFLVKLKKLKHLDLSGNQLQDLDFIKELHQLTNLYLKANKIDNINALSNLTRLNVLDLSNNEILDIDPLKKLVNLRQLIISGNNISNISVLSNLRILQVLDISNNHIRLLNPIQELSNLTYLKADNNPHIFESKVQLNESENHLISVKNIILREAEEGQQDIELPAKVLLLGNHFCGKSSLLSYMNSGNNEDAKSSTHIIKIEKYPSGKEIPDAIFFDFGGQDYYHGIYRAFLSTGSAYIILWNPSSNKNERKIDVNKLFTQDFTIEYWMSQKKYLETEKFDGENDPAILIQTYSDVYAKEMFKDLFDDHKIESQFYLSFGNKMSTAKLGDSWHTKNDHSLQYLKICVEDLVNERKFKTRRPAWYIDFLKFILTENESNDHIGKSVSQYVLPKYDREGENILELLKDDLVQFHNQGLVLYYEHIPDTVWLSPTALVEYIHDNVLTKDDIKIKKGKVAKDDFKVDQAILQLLSTQKVIFEHQYGEDGKAEYIIPNFLPLSNENDSEFALFTFGLGAPRFVLKFINFLPFGLINQIICFFGELPDKKKFWRDQLLFTFRDNAKILIQINFQFLEIRVHCTFAKGVSENEKGEIIKYLYFGILGLYWDFEILEFEDFTKLEKNLIKDEDFSPGHPMHERYLNTKGLFEKKECRPLDLFISVDDKHFIRYTELWDTINSVMIEACEIDEKRDITKTKKIIPIYPFQPFTNLQLKKRKKVAISYSKKDLTPVNKFRQYLMPLYDNELIDSPWYCTELIAGDEWNEEIQKKFNEADIIFFMISENLMSTKYVKENEIKNAIDRWDKDKSIKIVPIILVPYNYQTKPPYNLGRFTSIPFMLKPVSTFEDHHVAWDIISESIRVMIEKEVYPGNDFFALPQDLISKFEDLANKKY